MISADVLQKLSRATNNRSAFIEDAVMRLIHDEDTIRNKASEALINSYGAMLPATKIVYKNVKPMKLNKHTDKRTGREWTYGFGTHAQVEALNIEKDFNTALKTMNRLIKSYREMKSIKDNAFVRRGEWIKILPN